jgi:hypothetical protein
MRNNKYTFSNAFFFETDEKISSKRLMDYLPVNMESYLTVRENHHTHHCEASGLSNGFLFEMTSTGQIWSGSFFLN